MKDHNLTHKILLGNTPTIKTDHIKELDSCRKKCDFMKFNKRFKYLYLYPHNELHILSLLNPFLWQYELRI